DADLIVTSTSDVYGNAPTPLVEDGPVVLGPPTTRRWAYAASKLYDEHIVLRLAEERGLRPTILRLFNVYGPRNDRTWWGGPLSPVRGAAGPLPGRAPPRARHHQGAGAARVRGKRRHGRRSGPDGRVASRRPPGGARRRGVCLRRIVSVLAALAVVAIVVALT